MEDDKIDEFQTELAKLSERYHCQTQPHINKDWLILNGDYELLLTMKQGEGYLELNFYIIGKDWSKEIAELIALCGRYLTGEW